MAIRRVLDQALEQPWVYRIWQAPFAERKFAPVRRSLRSRPARRILDVGCGPGTNAAQFRGSDYVGIDINEKYLRIARARHPGLFVCADLTQQDLTHLGTFDTILVNSFLHHLPDDAVGQVLTRLANQLDSSGGVHILELVRPPGPNVAALMAYLDRGRYARSLESWRTHFRSHFAEMTLEPYTLAGLWSMVYFRGGARE